MRVQKSICFSRRPATKKFMAALFVLGSGPLLFCHSVVCAVNGFPQGSGHAPVGKKIPCSQAPVSFMPQFPKMTTSGNTITINRDASIGINPIPITKQYTGTLSFDHTFTLPSSPAGDVFKLSFSYGVDFERVDPGSYETLTVQLGPGSTSSPAISLNPANQSCEFGSCFYSATVPADAFSFLIIQGTAGLFVTPDDESSEGGVETGGGFTITRFKADGVTPDPFTATP